MDPFLEDDWVVSEKGWQYVLNGEYLNDRWHYIIDQYGEHWYYFDQNCHMLSNCWVGPYWLNEHGMWV